MLACDGAALLTFTFGFPLLPVLCAMVVCLFVTLVWVLCSPLLHFPYQTAQ